MAQARDFALSAPVPVLAVSTERAEKFTANEAAKQWDRTRHWSHEDWRTLAADVREGYARGETQGALVGAPIGWRGVADDGWLLVWLTERIESRKPPGDEFDLVGLSAWRLNLQTGRISLNRTGRELLGIGLEPDAPDVALDVIRSAMDPEDLRALRTAYQRAIASGSLTITARTRIRDRDRQWRTIYTRGVLTKDAVGDVSEIVGASMDVTNEQTDAEQLAALALEYAGAGVWTLDLVTGKRTWDDQMIRLRGYDPATAPSIEEIRRTTTTPEGRRALDESMSRVTALAYTEQAAQVSRVLPAVDYEVIWPDGSRHWLRVNGYIVKKDGENPCVIGLHWDVTQARQIDDLRNDKRLAQERANAISEAMATVSHEIRTPLNAILGLSRRLLRKLDTPDALDDVTRVETSARHMLGLVNDLLDLAKIEAGRLEFARAPFHLVEVASYAADMVRQTELPGASNIAVQVHVDADEFYEGDALRLSQVLVNLLTNAAKFSPRSAPVRLDVHAAPATASSHRLTFAVTDQGPGMTGDQLARLFKPFEQLGMTDGRSAGTGLGLAISQRLVRAMGGDIDVCSVPGQGSTFKFSIALDRRSGRAAEPLAFEPSASGVDLSGRVVLIVDDNDIGRELSAEIVAEAGARAISASNSAEALGALEHASVSVVIMDCEMPGMDGYALTGVIRLDPRWHEIPIVGLSGNATREQREKAIQSGMDDYLTKPVVPERLLNAIAWWSRR